VAVLIVTQIVDAPFHLGQCKPGMEVDYRQFFEVDPAKRAGKPCFKGTRLTPYDILSLMAAGISQQEILDDYPYLTEAHLRACLAFAADDRSLGNVLQVR
jgi:uncharacterized protein (DUF433 family)